MQCTNTQGRRQEESGVCVVRADGGAIGSEDFNRIRCTNAQGGREVMYLPAKRVVRV